MKPIHQQSKVLIKNRLQDKTCHNCKWCSVLSSNDYFHKIDSLVIKEMTGLTKEDIKKWVIDDNDILQCYHRKNDKLEKVTLIPKELTCKYWEIGE